MMIFIWLIIGFGIYFILKNSGSADSKPVKKTNAEDILKQRYVNGEIDDETYTRMMKIIKN